MENAETASKNLKFVHNMESFLIPYYNINQRPTHSGQIQLRKGDLNYEEFQTREEAMKREYAIKQLSRKEKEALIKTRPL